MKVSAVRIGDEGPAPRRANLQTLQCGRALAALTVVLFHANGIFSLPKYFGREVWHAFSSGGYCGVCYFFVLSGMVMVIAHRRQIGLKSSPLPFYLKRFNRIYLPLWVALFLTFLVIPDRGSAFGVVSAFLAWPASSEPLLAVEWSLRHEVLFYLIFGVILWRPALGFTVLTAWLAGSLVAVARQLDFPAGFIFSPRHLLFGFGMIAAVLTGKCGRLAIPLALLGMLALVSLWIWQLDASAVSDTTLVLLYGFASFLAIVGFAEIEVTRRLSVPAWLLKLGDASYAIYLVHFPVLSAYMKLAVRIDTIRSGVPIWVYFAGAVATAVALGLVFHEAVERRAIPLLTARWRRRKGDAFGRVDETV
jgi:exopolysaccharide production protein ExoZ